MNLKLICFHVPKTKNKQNIHPQKKKKKKKKKGKVQDPASMIFRASFKPMIFDFIKPAALLAMDRGLLLLWVEEVGEMDGGGGRGGRGDDGGVVVVVM